MNFSVLISIYKAESSDFLNQCLNSVLEKQSVIPNEVVIINDGDIPKVLSDIILIFKKKFPKIIINRGYEKNKGLGYALNFGLKLCTNEIIFRMDADDICNYNRFKEQLITLKKNPSISILGSYIEEFNYKPHDLKRIRKVPLSSSEINNKKLIRNPFNHMTVCFKKSHIIKAGGYLDMIGYEDYYLWLRVLNFSKGYNLDKSLVYARVGNNMVGRRQGYRFFINEIRFQKTIYNEGYQSFLSFIKNVILRGLPRLFPKFILRIIYKYLLRN